jgi:hypothetical protein
MPLGEIPCSDLSGNPSFTVLLILAAMPFSQRFLDFFKFRHILPVFLVYLVFRLLPLPLQSWPPRLLGSLYCTLQVPSEGPACWLPSSSIHPLTSSLILYPKRSYIFTYIFFPLCRIFFLDAFSFSQLLDRTPQITAPLFNLAYIFFWFPRQNLLHGPFDSLSSSLLVLTGPHTSPLGSVSSHSSSSPLSSSSLWLSSFSSLNPDCWIDCTQSRQNLPPRG